MVFMSLVSDKMNSNCACCTTSKLWFEKPSTAWHRGTCATFASAATAFQTTSVAFGYALIAVNRVDEGVACVLDCVGGDGDDDLCHNCDGIGCWGCSCISCDLVFSWSHRDVELSAVQCLWIMILFDLSAWILIFPMKHTMLFVYYYYLSCVFFYTIKYSVLSITLAC